MQSQEECTLTAASIVEVSTLRLKTRIWGSTARILERIWRPRLSQQKRLQLFTPPGLFAYFLLHSTFWRLYRLLSSVCRPDACSLYLQWVLHCCMRPCRDELLAYFTALSALRASWNSVTKRYDLLYKQVRTRLGRSLEPDFSPRSLLFFCSPPASRGGRRTARRSRREHA